jgi:hypothetical protein
MMSGGYSATWFILVEESDAVCLSGILTDLLTHWQTLGGRGVAHFLRHSRHLLNVMRVYFELGEPEPETDSTPRRTAREAKATAAKADTRSKVAKPSPRTRGRTRPKRRRS